jgi:hypothetical protein
MRQEESGRLPNDLAIAASAMAPMVYSYSAALFNRPDIVDL